MTGRIRKSQFVRIYGPGSIFSSGSTSGVLLRLARAEWESGTRPEDYRIDDEIMTSAVHMLLKRNGITVEGNTAVFEIPGYGEEGKPVFRLKAEYFPRWHLCTQDHGENRWVLYMYSRNGCPVCGNSAPNPVRFVMVCPYGHLDEVPWSEAVHGNARCRARYLYWTPHGTDVRVSCPECGRNTTLSRIREDVDSGNIFCSGRFPEQEKSEDRCPSEESEGWKPQILPRNASAVKINELLTLFAAWPRITEQHRFFLVNGDVRANVLRFYEEECRGNPEELKTYIRENYSEFREHIFRYVGGNTVRKFEELFEKDGEPRTEVLVQVIEDVYTACRKQELEVRSFRDILRREFENLIQGKEKGIPPSALRDSRTYIEIPADTGKSWLNRSFQVIDRLTVYQMLLGCRRIRPDGRFIDTGWDRGGNERWYPATVLGGEGIFITLKSGIEFELAGKSHTWKWLEIYREVLSNAGENSYRDILFRNGKSMPDELHPAFVFLHTLSHLLIRALGTLAGYSSTAIRERIYVFPDGNSALKAGGGIVLYSASEDEDGALGGLTSIARNQKAVRRLVELVLEQVKECSNDPVCFEQKINRGMFCGASCHACTTVSETSCEHRNMWLDRHVVLENLHLITG